ncbi:leucine-rich repeat extensin-like protein 2 [Rosa chinensis]|uniref:leucine-rich repeat extensin-like protein 2 n=1 Tax=Rosa chinensis TaxID=74649 RepID=UPI000D08C3DF|nr:leucine-rich repeat extensin-like protein 2 [Rosa chinensis]
MAWFLVSYKIKNLLGAPKISKPSANQAPPFNSVPNDYKKKIVSRARNCQYCSESDNSDCDEDERTYNNVPRRAPKGTMYRPRPPLALVHQVRPRPYVYASNWGRPPPPQPPLLPPPPPPYGYQNPYGYNLMPPPHLYGYQNNPYNYNFINGMVPQPLYPYYYGQKPRDPPVGNSFIHFLSDDNTASSCSLM